jgi:hypothetical protein
MEERAAESALRRQLLVGSRERRDPRFGLLVQEGRIAMPDYMHESPLKELREVTEREHDLMTGRDRGLSERGRTRAIEEARKDRDFQFDYNTGEGNIIIPERIRREEIQAKERLRRARFREGKAQERYDEFSPFNREVTGASQFSPAEFEKARDAADNLHHAMEATAKAQQDVLKAEREKQKAIQDQLKSFHDFANQQKDFYHNLVRSLEDKIQGGKQQFGAMTPVQRQMTLETSRALKEGRQLTYEQEQFARGNSFLKERMERRDIQRAEKDPALQQLMRDVGWTDRLKTAKGQEAQYAKVALDLRNKINVRMELEAKNVAQQLEKAIEPQMRKIATLLADQLHVALEKIHRAHAARARDH